MPPIADPARSPNPGIPVVLRHNLDPDAFMWPPDHTTCRIFRWAACFFASRL
jgi:hypothetical protein